MSYIVYCYKSERKEQNVNFVLYEVFLIITVKRHNTSEIVWMQFD